MAVSTVGVADASSPDKYLHTWSRTISGTAREDQYVQQGEAAYATYSVVKLGISAATAASHLVQLMGDGTNYSRIRKVTVWAAGLPASAAGIEIAMYRLSSAGTGGTAITPAPFDTADTYAGAAAYTPSSKGTEGALLGMVGTLWVPAAIAGAAPIAVWEASPTMKPIIIGTATSSGIAIKNIQGVASVTVNVAIEFTVTTYL